MKHESEEGHLEGLSDGNYHKREDLGDQLSLAGQVDSSSFPCHQKNKEYDEDGKQDVADAALNWNEVAVLGVVENPIDIYILNNHLGVAVPDLTFEVLVVDFRISRSDYGVIVCIIGSSCIGLDPVQVDLAERVVGNEYEIQNDEDAVDEVVVKHIQLYQVKGQQEQLFLQLWLASLKAIALWPLRFSAGMVKYFRDRVLWTLIVHLLLIYYKRDPFC